MSAPEIDIAAWSRDRQPERVKSFLERPTAPDSAEDAAASVLAEIAARGDAAIIEYAARFDNCDLSAKGLQVDAEEIAASADGVDSDFKTAAAECLKRVEAYAERGLGEDWDMPTPHGGRVGERYSPLMRIGAYIPGGAAPLVSTALMTVPIARAAGVSEIVACTPAGPGGAVNPYILYALDLAGATEVFRIGGIQAIGAMAYGSESVGPVQKIVGPGGPYVTAAKRQVYGKVGLDMVAGPSEIAVLADDSAKPGHVAADLLSQAEHGSGHEKILLATSSRELAEAVAEELPKQSQQLPKRETINTVLANGALIAVVPTLEDGVALCNLFAPEHMEVITENAAAWAEKITTAGAVFIGPWTPEAAGDFIAGPSHVLPTGGTAAIFSGLTVADFQRRSSIIEFTREDLARTRAAIEAFGRVETLAAHARSASIRFEEDAE